MKVNPTHKSISKATDILSLMKSLDIKRIENKLENNKKYHGLEKNIFINKLDKAFKQFILSGDSKLQYFKGKCNNELCSFDYTGCTFIGNKSRNFMNLIMKFENGNLCDIFECRNFKTDNIHLKKNQRIKIDESDSDFYILRLILKASIINASLIINSRLKKHLSF